MPSVLVSSPEWQALQAHQRAVAGVRLNELFAADPDRFRQFSVELDGMLVDCSRHFLTRETLPLLIALARARNLPAWIERMFNGEPINNTEQRAALHIALRANGPVMCEGRDVSNDVSRVLSRIETFTAAVRSGTHTGFTGKRITDVVSIGIGGSYLGPQFACQALRPYATGGIRAHFVSNVDGENLSAVLAGLDAATTLFVVISKTFGTQETMANAESARCWLIAQLGSESAVAKHFAAVTSNVDKVARFGISPENVFEMWDWVGGRYSLWSAVGLPVALYAGMDLFNALRDGARQMDMHFRKTPLERNLPVILGLLDIWYINFFGTSTRAVLPYAHALARLPAYLQQLEMESLGKQVTREGDMADYATGNIIWGEPGTDSQHSFFQLLHQGTLLIPADLIAACRSSAIYNEQHPLLLANFFAQGEALMNGKPAAAHAAIPGNRPSTSILVDEFDARRIGMLLALYEHKVFVQSVIWNINAFDQWGVALGKQVADRLLPELAGAQTVTAFDASTNGLVNYCKAHRR
ncbi:MAG TPA: glucose-6-phosphate isomerase [Burkholderiales bacterium]|nr:glucose-6-phosphate isomerase [Burkholderiales bacterium]